MEPVGSERVGQVCLVWARQVSSSEGSMAFRQTWVPRRLERTEAAIGMLLVIAVGVYTIPRLQPLALQIFQGGAVLAGFAQAALTWMGREGLLDVASRWLRRLTSKEG